jgi:hypothetical protein
MDSERFSPTALIELPEVERKGRLLTLEAELTAAIAPSATRDQFFSLSRQLIDRLRALGHDLSSFDGDGEEFETWCGDYSRKGGGGPLIITFRYPRRVQVEWSSSGRVG